MRFLPVFKNDIPYSCDIRIAGTTFNFTFNYNSQGDFFTVDLEKGDEVLAVGEKVVYGRAMFSSFLDARFPAWPIIPFDMAASVDRVGWRELGSDVFLFVIDPEELQNE